ncbi:MAG: MBOAT family O-acyltransferase [Polyangiaceae bacterium]
MPFSSIVFLFAFLPTFLCAYFLSPKAWRNAVALAGSLFFYAWGAPRFVLVLAAVSAVDYVFSRRIAALEAGSRARKALLAAAVSLNLLLLFYFKYANFVVGQLSRVSLAVGHGGIPWHDVLLPMGISFVVFEEISYLVDVYRGTAEPARRFSDYALFLSLFPHSIAGPIFRWKDLELQLRERAVTSQLVFDGFVRFCFGLAKKVLIANQVARVADQVFAHDVSSLPTAYAWLGLLAYTLQIYFDFSGYSDMAIGLGKVMGFSFKENFDAPYRSASITEFWRRWHISLSTWLRDYLYIPLGGNRQGPAKRYRNLVIVFVVCGFWHGANWTFLVWGAYHGALLVLEQSEPYKRSLGRLPTLLAVPFNFLLVMLGWVFFRADSLPHALGFFPRLFALGAVASSGTPITWGELLSHRAALAGAVGLIGSLAMAWPRLEALLAVLSARRPLARESLQLALLRWVGATGLLVFSTLSLVNSKFNPFIYFRF